MLGSHAYAGAKATPRDNNCGKRLDPGQRAGLPIDFSG